MVLAGLWLSNTQVTMVMTKFSLWLCNNLVSMDLWSHTSFPLNVNGNLVMTQLHLWRRNNLVSIDWWNHTSFPQKLNEYLHYNSITREHQIYKISESWVKLCSQAYQISCSSLVCDHITTLLPNELLMTALSDGSSLLNYTWFVFGVCLVALLC
jgi:hypothetical protein